MLELNKIKYKFTNTKGAKLYRIIRNRVKTSYYRRLSDERYLKIIFNKIFKRSLDLNSPKSFNEKLQWLKLYWRDPIAEQCADKYLVREYVKEKGLGNTLNALIDVYDNVDQINFDKLPDQFVLKCTHGSGCNIICKDKNLLNWYDAKKKLSSWMKINYYWPGREWVYKDLKPKIICEKYLEDIKSGELYDYKFLCFSGKPEYIFFCSDRENTVKSDYYNLDWELMDFKGEYPRSNKKHPKPEKLSEMVEYAKVLSNGFPFVRVDFYVAEGIVYFGELTFFHHGGFGRYYPENIDYELGNKLVLPSVSNREKKGDYKHV